VVNGLIIWDVDGTLVESGIDFPALKAELWRQVAAAGGRAPADPAATPLAAAVAEAERVDPELARRLWRRIERAEIEGERGDARAGAREALERCRRAGIVAVALTNNVGSRSRAQLGRLGLLAHLDAVYGREDVPAMKPSPLAVACVRRAHPAPWTVVVGDSWMDAAAAVAAGVGFVAVADLTEALSQHGLEAVPETALQDLPAAAMRVGLASLDPGCHRARS
jgi:phosphoglycolate phosphatase